MNIWIDLANAPHVVFFVPIIKRLRQKGHQIFLTLRDFNQTVELAGKYLLDGKIIGKHGGKNNFSKLINLVWRSRQLATHARKLSIDVSVSHNSYTHTLAGRLIGSKVITLMDYEGQPANHIAFRAAHKVLVPDCFPDNALRKFGAHGDKVYKYQGFKEQVYLSNFTPDSSFPDELKKVCSLPEGWCLENTLLITLRTPATMAAYHKFHNRLFEILLDKISGRPDLTAILLTRSDSQKRYYSQRYPNFVFPKAPVSGDQLVFHSDLVISAGGTMNREAAILGTPVYTIFAGMLPGVDQRLIEMGRMMLINMLDDIYNIHFEKHVNKQILKNPSLCEEIINQILN